MGRSSGLHHWKNLQVLLLVGDWYGLFEPTYLCWDYWETFCSRHTDMFLLKFICSHIVYLNACGKTYWWDRVLLNGSANIGMKQRVMIYMLNSWPIVFRIYYLPLFVKWTLTLTEQMCGLLYQRNIFATATPVAWKCDGHIWAISFV